MNKLTATLLASCIALAGASAFAADTMVGSTSLAKIVRPRCGKT